jgi:hypothetical protein
MATNKAKRSIHLAQPQPQPVTGPMPVKAHVYRAIADLNAGFELVIQSLKKLQQISFLPSRHFAAQHDLACSLRAEINRDLTGTLRDRESANTSYFTRLCHQRENRPKGAAS